MLDDVQGLTPVCPEQGSRAECVQALECESPFSWASHSVSENLATPASVHSLQTYHKEVHAEEGRAEKVMVHLFMKHSKDGHERHGLHT